MTSLLHQAVELAQTGRRGEARQLLLQYIQTSPNNEVAWLWLASVATDQPEYLRALNEVLRINPANQQAQQLLNEFRQQYGDATLPPGTSPASAPTLPPSAPVQAAPSWGEGVVVGPPAQPPAVQPSPYAASPQAAPPVQAGPPSPPPSPPPQVIEKVRVVEKKRGGCLGCGFPGCLGCLGCGGCWQSCLVLLVVVVVLPVVGCGLLSLAPFSLGPLDLPASYLPEDFGRKTIKFEGERYAVEATVPRSWYVADANNDMWVLWRDLLNEALPFADGSTTWQDFESQGQMFTLVETDFLSLSGAWTDGVGGPVWMTVDLGQPVAQSMRCETLRASEARYGTIVDMGDGLCGYWTDTTLSTDGKPILSTIDGPQAFTEVTFMSPVSADIGLRWELELPEEFVSRYEQDVQRLFESVKVTELQPS